MQNIFSKGAELEKLSKEKFFIPPFLMMENAAKAMAEFIFSKNPESVLIICGKGNNGGDGYALARLLHGKTKVQIVAVEEPSAEEAAAQYKMCLALEISIIQDLPRNISADIIVDCLYGIGFHGDLQSNAKIILDKINLMQGIKIACDIPSGLYFNADYTITMGEQKTQLYSDKAKSVCGQIIVADLGIPRILFEKSLEPSAYLIEEKDIKLPVRTNKSAHKGNYGHTTVFASEKSGAAVIAATSAMKFGSGLTTLLKTCTSNLEQFKISPELMAAQKIPKKTSAIVIGPGLGTEPSAINTNIELLTEWFKNAKNPSVVIDADLIKYEGLPELLQELNKVPDARIVLTPHLSELSFFLENLKNKKLISIDDCSTKALGESAELRINAGKQLNRLFSKTTVIMKSANTIIAGEGECFISCDGVQSLAKGGSGDVLAGMTGALLAQGYSAKEAAITAVEVHAISARKNGAGSYNLTPEKLIELISTFA